MEYKRIKDLRIDKDKSQKDVAEYLNIAQRTYSGYENGTRNIPVQIVVKLAEYYNTTTDYLLNLSDDRKIEGGCSNGQK